MKKIQSHPQNTGNEKSIFSNTTNNKVLRGEMGTRHQSIRGYEMRRWNRWITETQGFLSLCRYNAVNHYHLSESLLEEVLFQNPFAAIWCSKRQNLSAKHAQEIERLTDGKEGISSMERKEEEGGEKANSTNRKEHWDGEADSTGRQRVKSSLRGCTRFLPWLIKSGWGSGQLSAHPALLQPCALSHIWCRLPAFLCWLTCPRLF